MLTKQQFDVLSRLATKDAAFSDVAPSQTADELTELGFLANGCVTEAGLAALEPYRVKRVIFLAAGFGSRLAPITLNSPKPLVRVRGVRMIDTLMDACLKKGIDEFYVVRGYLGEQFEVLRNKYPNVKFIDNPDYNGGGTITSVIRALDLLDNAYIMESDLVLSNPDVIAKYHYTSDILGIWKKETDDWCFTTDEKGAVLSEKIGGTDCYQLIGIFYWNAEDSVRLKKDLLAAYAAPDGKKTSWSTVPFQKYQGEYPVFVRPCEQDDIIEIDSYRELCAIDPIYKIQ